MKIKCFILVLFLVMAAGIASAGLWDPPLENPSFENQKLNPGAWDQMIDSWFKSDYWGSFIERERTTGDIPETPYGENWAGLQWYTTVYMYQQIGTWDGGSEYDIDVFCGQRLGNNFGSIDFVLYVGGNPLLADNDVLIDEGVGAVEVSRVNVSIESFENNTDALIEAAPTFSISDYTTEANVGDPLWLVIQNGDTGKPYFDNIVIAPRNTATCVRPPNGAINVDVATDLEWGPSPLYTPTGYDLYYTTDPNFVLNITEVIGLPGTQTLYDIPTNLEYNTTYYWKVDSYDGATLYPGGIWNFTTAPAWPVVITQPASSTVAAGGSAQFTVEHVNGVYFQWSKDDSPLTNGGKFSGVDTTTLTVTDVQLDEEGFYTCELSNDLTTDTTITEPAQLLTKRLIAHWNFDDTLVDTVDGWTGVFTDPNELNPVPTAVYDTNSISGSSIVFAADTKYVEITDSADYFNFYPLGFTAAAWINLDTTFYYQLVVSKQDDNRIGGWGLGQTYGEGFMNIRGTNLYADWFGGTVTEGNWHMVVSQFDPESATLKLYVDGLIVAETDEVTTANIPKTPEPLVIGAETTSGRAGTNGLVDEVSIWSYAIDPFQIAEMYTDVTSEIICAEEYQLVYDYNDDCRIGIDDFATIAEAWMNCNEVPTCLDQHMPFIIE